MPLIAFAIALSDSMKVDTTMTVTTLLSLGANPDVIPAAFYSPYCRDLAINGPADNELLDIGADNKKWCTPAARKTLARTITLSQRYFLDKASQLKPPTVRHRQLTNLRNAEALLGVPHFLIGQTVAAEILLTTLLGHLVIPSRSPLVLVFAGPSGHGKTELARQLGHLLSLEMEVVDSTVLYRETDLFGPRAPYIG